MFKSILIYTISFLAVADLENATYSADLKCGKCIKEGYNFCFVGNDTQTFEKGTRPEATCCQDTSCAEASNSTWTCSGSYSDADYALTFCPFKKDKCGDTAEVEFDESVNVTQSLTVNDMSEGETCSFKIKSKCNAPGFKKTSAEGMDDTNTEVSFIEYKKSMVNGTEKDGDSEDFNSKKTKQPSDDKPPRNNSYSDMGKMNKSKCVYNYSQPIDTDVDAIATHWEGKAKVNATTESNNTLTIEVCFKKQSKPPRKYKNGTYTEKEDMEDASKEHWDEYQKENGDGPPSKDSSYYVDDAGVHTVGKQKGPKREKDSDGWDGKTYDQNKTDWGKSYEDEQF